MTQKDTSSRSSSVNRRGFFRRILLSGLEKAEQASAAMGEQLAVLGQLSQADAPQADAVRYLRPPGSMAEPDFAEACSRCGDCVEACPANCIQLDLDHNPDDPVAGGLPYIVARQSPCVVCEDLSCMRVCPTGALNMVEKVEQIDMGLAEVDQARCLRSAPQHEDCQLCITSCPLGEAAIGLDERYQVRVLAGCIGCGVCEHVCPTEPASIQVSISEL